MTNGELNPRMWKAVHVAIVALAGLCTTLVGYQTSQISSLQRELVELKVALATTNASRFTAADSQLMWQSIASMKEILAELRTTAAVNSKRIDQLQSRQP
jgi:hypothetical protein